ncbi:molybdenum cofactor guanylyltransferase [Tunturiibacter lichenicola]|jgi:molybdenum cofactor guanylyltransferase|uniref:molybdenum cofactor guanylyltransferase n=1 Tax=Tunturiibacter lichenicola TaxID=2051959 RepID=UPI003D9B35DC
MQEQTPEAVGGYVLAGGKSSRMGANKALLELAGKPLVRHAVEKLRRVCADVWVLSNDPKLSECAPVLPDLHPECGPMGGMEAALLHSAFDWNLFLPVDMPFLPSSFIAAWLRKWLQEWKDGTGMPVRMLTVDGRPQPGFCLLHKDVVPFLSVSLDRAQFKLLPAFEAASKELAIQRRLLPGARLWNVPVTGFANPENECREGWSEMTDAQQAAKHLWFANLNTPEELAEAKLHVDALDA